MAHPHKASPAIPARFLLVCHLRLPASHRVLQGASDTAGVDGYLLPRFGEADMSSEEIVEHLQGRRFRAHPCWKCGSPAAWHVTEDEWEDTLWACVEHKTEAFS